MHCFCAGRDQKAEPQGTRGNTGKPNFILMKLTIDNLDGRGARDYTAFLDGAKSPRVLRKLNSPTELRLSLVPAEENFVVPVAEARGTLCRSNGIYVFTGYIAGSP